MAKDPYGQGVSSTVLIDQLCGLTGGTVLAAQPAPNLFLVLIQYRFNRFLSGLKEAELVSEASK